jgi:hypothetical protein
MAGRRPSRQRLPRHRLGGWMTANNWWIQVGFGFGIWLLVKGVKAL